MIMLIVAAVTVIVTCFIFLLVLAGKAINKWCEQDDKEREQRRQSLIGTVVVFTTSCKTEDGRSISYQLVDARGGTYNTTMGVFAAVQRGNNNTDRDYAKYKIVDVDHYGTITEVVKV